MPSALMMLIVLYNRNVIISSYHRRHFGMNILRHVQMADTFHSHIVLGFREYEVYKNPTKILLISKHCVVEQLVVKGYEEEFSSALGEYCLPV